MNILSVISIFDITLSENILKNYIESNSVKDIPEKEIFGVFTTITRGQKLNEWPEDIHGCLGYWTDDFSRMSNDMIIKKVRELSYDTATKDSRKNYFKRDLSDDSGSNVEISFMTLPIIKVDERNGRMGDEIFDNEKYGLIVEFGGKRATYLPGVFKNMKWEDIKKSLLSKAGLNQQGKFYSYKTSIIKTNLYETLFSEKLQTIIEMPVGKFLYEKYVDFVPFMLKNGRVIVEMDEDVRNLGTIGDVIRFSKRYDFSKKMNVVERNMDYYYKKYEENPEMYRQSSAFLLENYHLLNIHPERMKNIINYLYNNLYKMEPRFELGEVLKILSIVEPRKSVLEREAKKMYERLGKMNGELDDVFELNWQSQFIQNANIPSRKKNAEKISKVLLMTLGKNKGDWETNYYAVIYECLSNLVKIIKNDELKNKRMEYFVKLNKRKGEYGLYFFKGMNEARIDITSHVIFQP